MPGQWRTRGEVAPIWPGSNHDLGSTWSEESTNFAVWAPEATAAYLCLVDDDDTETRHRLTERTLGIWHGAVPGIRPGQRYGYRVEGPWAPDQGLRFNPQKLLLDPYARAVSGRLLHDPAIFGYSVDAPESRDVLALRGLRSGLAQLVLHLEADRVHLRPVEPDGADTVGHEADVGRRGLGCPHREVGRLLRPGRAEVVVGARPDRRHLVAGSPKSGHPGSLDTGRTA